MAELRYNPILRDWTMVAANRQVRPDMPAESCPFCPGSGKVPDHYDVLSYDNDFPVLSPSPNPVGEPPVEIYRAQEAYGKCEVVLYSSDHDAALSRLSSAHVTRVVQLWRARYADLTSDPRHQYVLIFENRGREVGATIAHPHGQIYAYPFLPIKIRSEIESAEQHGLATGHCLLCDITDAERDDGRRLVAENDRFLAFIPYFTDFPFGVWIGPKRHLVDLRRFDAEDEAALADILSRVTRGMDALYQREFPYMMALHQTPPQRPETEAYYHFHLEFYPPLRAADKIKFLASSETGAGAAANPLVVEETAPLLRRAIAQAESEESGR
ncbi:MAG: galactose-1-phosphate uridylyltransferase [Firmicutes bacterium]|nr:galactose-1-phosphate uridylyltransferase [Bacillota bacterium]